MIRSIRMQQFKNFQDASLVIGPLTVLIGTNASGKTNVLDAFRFLHGISRGYNLAEIIGEKWGEGGVLQWKGIRGGTREVSYMGAETFTLGFEAFTTAKHLGMFVRVSYKVEIAVGEAGKAPRVVRESLSNLSEDRLGYRTVETVDRDHIRVQLDPAGSRGRPPSPLLRNTVPILHQIADDIDFKPRNSRLFAGTVISSISSFRFLDLSPTAMRLPSLPGQVVLGDKGENLSSVLLAICEEPQRKQVLLEWINRLTPMDARDFEFPTDQLGRILLTLVEQGGHRTTAHSASDGTLRFLAILAALFGPAPASFYFIEELENGIHPTRLGLLVDLIESQTKRRNIQVVATSHSPLLLQFLSEDALENASLVYRLPDHPDARIKRILEIPDARRVIKEQSVSLLHSSNWFEDALDFADDATEEAASGLEQR